MFCNERTAMAGIDDIARVGSQKRGPHGSAEAVLLGSIKNLFATPDHPGCSTTRPVATHSRYLAHPGTRRVDHVTTDCDRLSLSGFLAKQFGQTRTERYGCWISRPGPDASGCPTTRPVATHSRYLAHPGTRRVDHVTTDCDRLSLSDL